MSAKTGSNGVEDGKLNVQKFLSWKASVEDFRPYIWQGELNKSQIAREADFSRSVWDSNKDVAAEFLKLVRELTENGVLKASIAKPNEIKPDVKPRSSLWDSRMKQLQEEHEAVKAENAKRRTELAKLQQHKVKQEILEQTGRLPW